MANGNNTTNTGFPGYKEKEISPFSDPFTGQSFVLPTSSYNTDARINYERQKAVRARTQGLIELDPTTAESLLLNIGGAWEEAQERKQFDDIRKTAIKDEMAKAKRKEKDKMLGPWTEQMKASYEGDPSMQRFIQSNWGFGKPMSKFNGDIVAAKAWIKDQPITQRFLDNRVRDASVYNDGIKQIKELEDLATGIQGKIDFHIQNKEDVPTKLTSMLAHLNKQIGGRWQELDPNYKEMKTALEKEDIEKKVSQKLRSKDKGKDKKTLMEKWSEWTQIFQDKFTKFLSNQSNKITTDQTEPPPQVTDQAATATTATEDDRLAEGIDFQPMSDEAFKRMTGVDGQKLSDQPSPVTPSVNLDKMKAMSRKTQGVGKPANVKKLSPLTKKVVGATPDGRKVIENKDGTRSSERSRTFKVGDKWYNYPSMFDGVEETNENKLREIFIDNNGVDPETGIKAKGYNSLDEALAVAEGRSQTLGVVDNTPPIRVDNMEGKGDRPPTRNIKDLFDGFKNLLDFGNDKRIDGNVINNKIYEEGENLPPEEKTKWFEAWGQAADDYMNVTNNPLGPGQVLGRGGNFITGKLIEGVGWASDIARSLVSGDSNDNVDNRDPLQSRLEAEKFQERRRDERNRNNIKPDNTTSTPDKTDSVSSGGYSKKVIAEAKARSNFAANQLKTKHPNIRKIATALQLTESGGDPNVTHNILQQQGGRLVPTDTPSGAIGSSGVTATAAKDTNNKKINNLIKNMSDDSIRQLLRDPKMNTYISTAYYLRLHKQLRKDGYGVGWSDKDYEDLVSASYNGGIGRVKKGLDESKPNNMKEYMNWMKDVMTGILDVEDAEDYRQIHTHVINYRIHRRGR